MLDERLNGPVAAYHIRAKEASESICAHDTTKKANQPPPILHPITSNPACLGILFDHRIIAPGEVSIKIPSRLRHFGKQFSSFHFLHTPRNSAGPEPFRLPAGSAILNRR